MKWLQNKIILKNVKNLFIFVEKILFIIKIVKKYMVYLKKKQKNVMECVIIQVYKNFVLDIIINLEKNKNIVIKFII